MAPTCGSAHGTTEPTARNFDCVATPHCWASRSHAAIEYVATRGSAIRELRQIQLEQRGIVDERHRYLRPRERSPNLVRRARVDDDRASLLVRRAERLPVAPNHRSLTARRCLLGRVARSEPRVRARRADRAFR